MSSGGTLTSPVTAASVRALVITSSSPSSNAEGGTLSTRSGLTTLPLDSAVGISIAACAGPWPRVCVSSSSSSN